MQERTPYDSEETRDLWLCSKRGCGENVCIRKNTLNILQLIAP